MNTQTIDATLETQTSISIVRSQTGNGYRLEASQLLPHPRDQVFEFFSDATNLQALTPAWLHFSVITPSPIRITTGTLIDYRLRVHGVPLRWQSRISTWAPPFRFVDEQIRGPYRRWHHEHVFEEIDSGTLCRDVVDYAVYGGALINKFFVQSDLLKIFAYRQDKLRGLFPQEGASMLRLANAESCAR